MGSEAQATHKKRASIARSATNHERLICPFDLRAFAQRHRLPLTELGREIGVEGANIHNWFKQIPGFSPLSVAKAAMLTWEPAHIPAFEESIRGKIIRRDRTLFITDKTARIARAYDRKRHGERLIMKDGAVLILQNHPPEPDEKSDEKEPEAPLSAVDDPTDSAPDDGHAASADHTPAPAPTPPAPPPEIPAEIEAASILPPRSTAPTTYELNTARGIVRVELPVVEEVSAGEREIYTALLLRLNVQNSELHRRNYEMDVQLRDAMAQINGWRARVKELAEANRELVEASRTTAAKGVVTVQTATAVKIATPKDAASVKAAVREVPELERMVEQLMKENPKVEAGTATTGFTLGAASTTRLQ